MQMKGIKMKKMIMAIVGVTLAVVLTGCSKSSKNESG